VQCNTIPNFQYSSVRFITVQYSAVNYSSVPISTVQYGSSPSEMNIHTRYVANNSNRSVSKCHVPAVSKAATGTRDDGTMCWSVTQSLLCTPVTYYMDRTPVSTGQEIRLKLWNPKVRHPDHNIPPLVPVLRQVNPVHGLPSYFVNANCNIILSSTLKSSKRFLALRSSIHSVACNLLSLSHDARPAHCVSCTLSPH